MFIEKLLLLFYTYFLYLCFFVTVIVAPIYGGSHLWWLPFVVAPICGGSHLWWLPFVVAPICGGSHL